MTDDGRKVKHEWVPLTDCFVDPSVQRPEQKAWSKRLADTWDEDKAQVPHLSKRASGKYHVADGQHQIAARRILGQEGVWAMAHYGLTRAEEAKLFVGLNENRGVHAVDMFVQRVNSGDELYVQLNGILLAYGWHAGRSGKEGSFAAVTTYRQAAQRHSTEIAERTLKVITQAWGHDPDGAFKDVVSGIAHLLAHRESLDQDMLIDKLTRESPVVLRRRAAEQARALGPSRRFANALIGVYNTNLRKNKLQVFV
jgi:hypothetical protein